MAAETTSLQEKKKRDVALPLIRKLTTEKAVKAHRQQTKEKAAAADEITNIKLSGRGIKTIESFDLPSLRRLDLSKNNLNRLKGLQSCPEVTYLTAAGNELTGEGLDGVRPLRGLKVFNASGNRVRRIPPPVFAQFRQLQALVLNNNEIAEVPPTWFKKGLLTLNTLVLSHNKVKSLSDTGLGRLTALTKISVSHNELCELPDLSACSALEELRAAHNLISEVPSSLGKNVKLRTLDLGHNTIEGWGGLERVGKTLASLVQITLAGNPICANAPSGTEATNAGTQDGGDEGAVAREGDGEYVTKVRSLFPSLKVRDGKRILMKKSHTYYEQRAAEANADASGGCPSPSEGGRKFGGGDRPGKGSGDGGGGRKLDGQKPTRRLKGAPAAAAAAAGGGGGGGDAGGGGDDGDAVAGKDKKVSGNVGTSSGDEEKKARRREARRLLKKEEGARAAAAGGGGDGARIEGGSGGGGEAGAAGASDLPGITSDKRSDKRSRLPKDEEDTAGLRSKKKKKRRREAKDSPEAVPAANTATPGERNPRRDSETSVAEQPTASTAQQDKKQRTKKKSKAIASTGEGRRAAVGDSGGGGSGSGGGDGGDKDPYSSSEELPVPGRRAGKKHAGGDVKGGGGGGGAKSALQEGDRESGVVSVVLNRKRKGAKGAKGKPWQPASGGGGLQCDDAEAGGGGEVGFSVEGMLAARGQRETVGLGSGVSAWG